MKLSPLQVCQWHQTLQIFSVWDMERLHMARTYDQTAQGQEQRVKIENEVQSRGASAMAFPDVTHYVDEYAAET